MIVLSIIRAIVGMTLIDKFRDLIKKLYDHVPMVHISHTHWTDKYYRTRTLYPAMRLHELISFKSVLLGCCLMWLRLWERMVKGSGWEYHGTVDIHFNISIRAFSMCGKKGSVVESFSRLWRVVGVLSKEQKITWRGMSLGRICSSSR